MSQPTLLWIALAIFVLGLFIGTNLGVMLMCVLQANSRQDSQNEGDQAVDDENVPRGTGTTQE